jgi:hypothetical protein
MLILFIAVYPDLDLHSQYGSGFRKAKEIRIRIKNIIPAKFVVQLFIISNTLGLFVTAWNLDLEVYFKGHVLYHVNVNLKCWIIMV